MSVAAGQLDRIQTSQKNGFENHNTTGYGMALQKGKLLTVKNQL